MKKNIIITAGPTNERLDAVMKITNMSTGTLGAIIADDFLENKSEEIKCLYYLSTKLSRKPTIEDDKVKLIVIESAEDLKKEGIKIEEHPCSILTLSKNEEYFYGEFKNHFSRFGRSDTYENNPQNMEIGKLEKG